jgi:hypothetical protein
LTAGVYAALHVIFLDVLLAGPIPEFVSVLAESRDWCDSWPQVFLRVVEALLIGRVVARRTACTYSEEDADRNEGAYHGRDCDECFVSLGTDGCARFPMRG